MSCLSGSLYFVHFCSLPFDCLVCFRLFFTFYTQCLCFLYYHFVCNIFAFSFHIFGLHSYLNALLLVVSHCLSFYFCLSISLMEHLPTHTFPHSCPLLTHLSIHTCLSAYVCIFVCVQAFIGKAKTVAHVSTPVRPHCSPPMCMCVCVCLRGTSCQEKQADEKEDISTTTSAAMCLLVRW